jgi:hypothetical protein
MLIDDDAGVAREAGAGLFELRRLGRLQTGAGVEEREAAVRLDD